jgi:hypothetical protein
MRVDMRPRYRVKEKIIAKGYENEITIPYKGKSLEKIFDKESIVVGQTKNIGGQNVFSVIENSSENTFDKDTKQPFIGRVEFALDPSKLENIIEVQYKTETQGEPESDLQYYTSAKFLKRASYSIIPVALIGGYSYYKKFNLVKSALLVSIPIVAITIMQNIGFGGGKNAYWGIFIPPSVSAKKYAPKQIKK